MVGSGAVLNLIAVLLVAFSGFSGKCASASIRRYA